MGLLFGRTGCLTTKNAGFRPGQGRFSATPELADASGCLACAPGRYSRHNSSTMCQTCDGGSYAAGAGAEVSAARRARSSERRPWRAVARR
jgi:hypothetical protein